MAAPRREYGEGSVYQRKSDWRWMATLEAGWNSNGTRRRIPVSSKGCVGGCREKCPHRAEIRKKLRDKRLAVERDGLPTAGTGGMTVKTFAEQWSEHRKTKVRAKPWATDASALKQWIIPTIGHKRLDQITPADVRAVAAAQRKAGRSTSTAARTHTTLTGLLRDAMIDGHQVPARVLLVDAPGIADNDRDEMPVPELLLCLNAAHELLPHWSRWFLQALYGMRPAEVLGVTDEALDFDRGVLVVKWQLQALPYLDRADKARGFQMPDGLKVKHLVDAWHLVEVKTKKGERVLPLVPEMARAIHDWLPQRTDNPWGLVWPNAKGRPANEKHDLAEWYALQDTVGVRHPTGRRYYIYEARHGLATRLMEEGVDDHVITALMGHSSIVTSRGYMHANQRHALEAMEKVATRLQLTGPTDGPARTA